MSLNSGSSTFIPFAKVKNGVKRSYLSPLLEIHNKKNPGPEDKRSGFVTIEDLESSNDAATTYIDRTCHGGQKRKAMSFLEQLHRSQLDAYDEYFHRNVWMKERGQTLVSRWTKETQSWNELSLSKHEFENRVLTAFLGITVSRSDRQNRTGRYVFDGWRLQLSHIFKWIVDPFVQLNYAVESPGHAGDDGGSEAGEVHETDEAEHDDDNDSGEADDEDAEEGGDGDAVETETEAEENDDENGADEEEGEIDEAAGVNGDPSSSVNNDIAPRKNHRKNGSQISAAPSSDDTASKSAVKSKLLKRKIASLGGSVPKGEAATKTLASKKKLLGGALGSGRKASSAPTGSTPKKKKESSDATLPTKAARQPKKRPATTNGSVAATAQTNVTKKAKRGGRGGRPTRKKLS